MSSSSLSPRVVQVTGLVLIVGFSVFWAVTGRVQTDLIIASGGLVAAGQGWQDLRTFLARVEKRLGEQPPLPPDEHDRDAA